MRLASALLCCLSMPAAQAESFAQREDVQAFVSEMETRHGFAPGPLLALFHRTRPVPTAIRLVMPPRDPGIRSWHAYRARFVEPKRIAAGARFMAAHADTLARAESRWGVPREIVAAIIGIETIYGRHTGGFGTFAALATLAFDYPPRAELFRGELEELLLLAREQEKSPLDYKGSYAGALGVPQFLPSSWRRHGVDFDGDARIDLRQSTEDAIGSVANFLAAHGWQAGQPIAERVIIRAGDAATAVALGIEPRRTVSEWRQAGYEFAQVHAPGDGTADVSNVSPGGDLESRPAKVSPGRTAPADLPAALIDLVTPNADTEYRLGYRNFHVITRYNRSSFYAAAVMDLAAALAETARPDQSSASGSSPARAIARRNLLSVSN